MTSTPSNGSGGNLASELYEKRQKIYPREVHGTFAVLRIAGVFFLMGAFYLTPWLEWGGQQLLLFDLPQRKFHIFGLIFWPQDFIYLTGMLTLAALSLFFFTAIFGRVWCGYACPQTVWTEVFLWIERKVEGDRQQQIKLDKMPFGAHKLFVKSSKHILWISLSLWTGFTFVGYFTPIRELAGGVLNFSTGPWETFWIFFYGFATYGNAGWMREQVCTYMCPYARFQSAMFDPDTLIISYDKERGDPRGSRSRSQKPAELGLGDCIDCTLCVQACPTGIDIRDGLQYKCISCAACIDACDSVMDKMGYQQGLVRYTTENELAGKASSKGVLRPRILIYASLLIVITIALFWNIITRDPLAVDVIRDRNTLFRETSEGLVENVYRIKIMNMSKLDQSYSIEVSGLPGLTINEKQKSWPVESGQVGEFAIRTTTDPGNLTKTSQTIFFHVSPTENDELIVSEEARFIGNPL